MTYQTGTAANFQVLIGLLGDFGTTVHGGWAEGYSPSPNITDGWFELSKGTLSFSLKFAVGANAPVKDVSIHHATAFAGVLFAPGAHTDDSGIGFNAGSTGHTNAQLAAARGVTDIGRGPYTFYFFADDTSPNDYIHCVIETADDGYRHFGFGNLVAGDAQNFGSNWVGGEYVYGHLQGSGTAATAVDVAHTTLLDGIGDATNFGHSATISIRAGLANQGTSTWAVVTAHTSPGNDTGGKPRQRVHGGFRAGMDARGFANMIGSITTGWIPSYSIAAYYKDPSNARVYLLGYMPDVRALNIGEFSAAQEVSIGSDTWIMFPMANKTNAAVDFRTLNSGIMYRKVT